MRTLIFLTLLTFIFASCDSNRVFEEYETIETDGWHKDSAAVFSINLDNTEQGCNLLVNIRNNSKYPNSNIWLFIDITSPDGTMLTDTIEYTLADKTGKWTGSGIGDLFDNQFSYKQNIFFPVAGEYSISIKQGMRSTKLKGIQDIGFRIEKIN